MTPGAPRRPLLLFEKYRGGVRAPRADGGRAPATTPEAPR
ncbi:hypothetical protein Ga0080559_TMP3148 [Salipiger profundus]|uniref:Uncharacterized protein n=1 Tax=Salipiger profundus TaxID=1229727 RepID=A0A1U7D701_9RHOB|nr:hypothetical protein Ga0080559_TMP3148 [Salipiger profundus]